MYYFILGAIDLLTLAGIVAGEIFAFRRAIYGAPDLTPEQRKKRRIIVITIVAVVVIAIAAVAIYFIQYYLAHQL